MDLKPMSGGRLRSIRDVQVAKFAAPETAGEGHKAHAAAKAARAVGLASATHRTAAKHLETALEHHREAAWHLERGNHAEAKRAWKSAKESMEAARYSHGELGRHHELFKATQAESNKLAAQFADGLPQYGAPPKEAHDKLVKEGFKYNTSHHPDYATSKHHYTHPDGREALVHERTDLKSGTSKHSIQYSRRAQPGKGKFEDCQLKSGRLRSVGDLAVPKRLSEGK